MPSKKPKNNSENKEEPIKNIFGWNGIDEVAQDLWAGIHSSLLSGEFIFAYRGTSEINQLVITRRLDDPSMFMIGMITSGWTMLLPRAPKDYLLGKFLEDLVAKKLNNNIIYNYTKIINKI